MAIGSRKKRGGDEYIFIDGKAMRADEAVRIELTENETSVPGQAEAQAQHRAQTPGEAAKDADKASQKKHWNAKKALRELDSGDAFEVDEAGVTELVGVGGSAFYLEEKRKTRRTYLIMALVLVVVSLASLCIGYSGTGAVGEFYNPATVLQAYGRRIYLFVGQIFNLDYYDALAANRAANEIPGYSDILARANVTFVTLVCGFLLSVAGMLYQNVFRNPIASPTMLGVSAGVRIGTIILVLIYGTAATTMQGQRYFFCYAGGIIILLVVLLFSKLLAKGRPINVADMLIVGSIASQLLSTVSQYFLTIVMDEDEWEVFYELTSGMRGSTTEWYGFIFLFVIILVSILPVVLLRFRINTVAFSDGESRLMGVDPRRMRVFVLCMGTLAILAAQIHVGVITMVSLVVPFLVRYIVGSEFRKQLMGNILLGPLMLIICRDICALIPFVGGGLSLEMVVGFVALPVYVWMMALGRKGWE